MRLEEGPPHTKNWRPQVLVLAKLNDDLSLKYRKMLSFASQLKAGKHLSEEMRISLKFSTEVLTDFSFAGKGLTVCVSVLEGDFARRASEANAAKQNLRQAMTEEKVKGFADTLVSHSIADGLSHL